MKLGQRPTTALLIAAYIAAGVSMGCAARVGYRAYDPVYGDYHPWNDQERGYYNQWVVENHRPHRDYRKLDRNDQAAYWKWRHTNHPDHDKH